MPYGRRGSSRRRGLSLRPVNSIKNYFLADIGISGTPSNIVAAKAVTSPSPTVTNDVSHGCNIKAIYLTIDVCGIAGTGVLNVADMYIMKNPGDNLAEPDPKAWGGSNEKKFIFRTWRAMIMRNQDGNVPYHWEGWVPIPFRYQRMGTDDTLIFMVECTSGLTGHASFSFLYKWYR